MILEISYFIMFYEEYTIRWTNCDNKRQYYSFKILTVIHRNFPWIKIEDSILKISLTEIKKHIADLPKT